MFAKQRSNVGNVRKQSVRDQWEHAHVQTDRQFMCVRLEIRASALCSVICPFHDLCSKERKFVIVENGDTSGLVSTVTFDRHVALVCGLNTCNYLPAQYSQHPHCHLLS